MKLTRMKIESQMRLERKREKKQKQMEELKRINQT
jgi:hypothetical protein